jgi:hypothetical protein
MRTVFQYTAPFKDGLVAFVKLEEKDGKTYITVRGQDQQVGTAELPRAEVVKLKQQLFDLLIGR